MMGSGACPPYGLLAGMKTCSTARPFLPWEGALGAGPCGTELADEDWVNRRLFVHRQEAALLTNPLKANC